MCINNDILLVVLYNETLSSSETISSYMENCKKYHNRIKMIIWDNSPVRKISSEDISNCIIKFEYYHTPQNTPLSVIYNKVIKNSIGYASIFIFDQDSILTNEYFDKIFTAQNQYPQISLFIPRVIHEDKVISPARRFLHRGEYKFSPNISGIIESKKFIGIMSGMNIRMNLFKSSNIEFDEHLTFYGIDVMFSIDYSKICNTLFIIDYTLQHDLSMFKEESVDIKNKRFESHVASLKYIAKRISIWAFLSCMIAIYKKKLFNQYASKVHTNIQRR